MNVTLLQCPANNPDSPPYSLALLKAALENSGHNALVYDLNITLFKEAKRKGLPNVWSQGHSQEAPIEKWIEQDYTAKNLAPHMDFIDAYINDVIEKAGPVIGFTAHTSSFWSSLLIAQKIKKLRPDIKIAFGGPYCFLNHQGLFILDKHPEIDMVCFLEAEKIFPELLHRMEKKEDYYDMDGFGFRREDGSIILNYVQATTTKTLKKETFISNLDDITFADWSSFNFDDYEEKYLPIITGRGCIRRCSFCNEAPVWGKFRTRSADNISAEIFHQSELYPHIEVFWFMDSLINGNIQGLEELCDILIAKQSAGPSGKWRGNGNFGFTGQFLIRPEMTEDMWRKISLAGGQWFACGLENGSDSVLKHMRKGYKSDLAKKVVDAAVKVDPELLSVAMFVVGHPGETRKDFEDTMGMIRFLKERGVSSSVSICDVRRDSPLWFMKDKFDVVMVPDAEYPEGNPHTWYTKDGYNTPKRRDELLKETLDMNATMLHTLKPGEKGLVDGSINLHDTTADIQTVAAQNFKKKRNALEWLKELIN